MRILRSAAFLPLLLAGILTSALLAQSPTGSITGTVSDPSGAVIPGAKVEITNVSTGISRATTTDAMGDFQFPLLSPGTYRLKVEFTGFSTYVQDGIVLNVAEKPDIDVVLKPGQLTQTVEVTGTAPLLETNTSDVGQNVTRRQVEDLPLNGRNVISLELLANGVAPVNGVNNSNYVWGSYINGGRQGSSEVLYDGVSNTFAENNPGTWDLARTPPLASIEEFKLITNSMSAEYGGTTGGLFSMVSRSGTNAFHGEVFEFLRNSALNSVDFFTNREGGGKEPTKKNQFGFAVGGPIRRDKTFFFFHYEGNRERYLSNYGPVTIPTMLQRVGDFSETYDPEDPTTWIYSPFATAAPLDVLGQSDPRYNLYPDRGGNTACAAVVPGSGDGTTRPPFPGNIIPPECLDPVSLAVAQYYPQPTNDKLVDNFFGPGSGKSSSNSWDIRIDHNISDKQRLFARFGRDSGNSPGTNFFGNIADPTYNPYTSHVYQAVFEHTYNFSPTTLFTTRLGYTRHVENGGVDPALKDFRLTDLGFPQNVSDYAAMQNPQYFPNFYIEGYSTIGTVTWAAYHIRAETYTWESVLTKLHGRHSLKIGYSMHMYRDNEGQPGIPAGYYGFYGNQYTSGPSGEGYTDGGSALADMLIGGVGWGAITYDFDNATQSYTHSAFIQDDIRVSSKLTLNLGLRYDLTLPRTERYNRQSFWDGDAAFPVQLDSAAVSDLEAQLGTSLPHLSNLQGGLGFPGVNGVGRRLYKADTNNWGPRIGFAYRAFPKTVFRGAFGVMYGPSYKNAAGNGATTQDSFAYAGGPGMNSTFYADDGHQEPIDLVHNPFPYGLNTPSGSSLGLLALFGEGPGGAAIRVQPDPYMLNWNFGVERELPGNILVQASYVANHSLRWGATYSQNLNTLTPNQITAAIARYGDSGFDSAAYNNPFFDLVGPGGQYEDPNSPYFYPLLTAQQLTARYPQFPGVGLAWPAEGNSIYHSFQLRAEKRASKGLTFLVNYTNSKLIDNGEGTWAWLGNHGVYQTPWDLKAERSLSANDISQRLSISYLYELPFGRGKRFLSNLHPVADIFLGGWRTSSIIFFSKGVPVNWAMNAGDFNRFLPNGRPDKVCDGVKSGAVESRLDAYFDTSCFQTPPDFGVGTAPRTDPRIRWPGTRSWDFSLMKDIPIKEKVTVQFRSEFFNFTNTPQFGFQGGNCCNSTEGTNFSDDSTFGRLRHQVNSPREIQFGLRLLF
jgi:hypothetical protein